MWIVNIRLPQSKSSSDFVIELNENFECPQGTKCWITEVSLPTTWKTTEVGFYENLYIMVFDGDTLVKNFKVYLGNKIYFAEQLAYDMVEGMNSNTTDLYTDGIFVYAYSSATRTVEIKIKDGLSYSFKIPTDEELSNYVGSVWDTGQSSYDSNNPVSINYLLSNFVATSPLTTFTSSYMNLVPFRSVLLHCHELADHHYSSPSSYSSNIVKKIIIDAQLGGIVNEVNSQPFMKTLLTCSNKNLKRLSFRITDTNNKTLNLYNIDVQFSIVFGHPSY